jgi:hypothetical protein
MRATTTSTRQKISTNMSNLRTKELTPKKQRTETSILNYPWQELSLNIFDSLYKKFLKQIFSPHVQETKQIIRHQHENKNKFHQLHKTQFNESIISIHSMKSLLQVSYCRVVEKGEMCTGITNFADKCSKFALLVRALVGRWLPKYHKAQQKCEPFKRVLVPPPAICTCSQ